MKHTAKPLLFLLLTLLVPALAGCAAAPEDAAWDQVMDRLSAIQARVDQLSEDAARLSPAGEAPTAEPPAEAPSSPAPSSEEPSSEAPSSEEPSSEAPSSEEPSSEVPSGEAFSQEPEENGDLARVREAGVLTVGVTDFPPMSCRDEDGQWTGFDADMARAFADSLGVEAEFVELGRDELSRALEDGEIDCVWCGMALTEEAADAMECSVPYCTDAQAVIIPAVLAEEFSTEEALEGLLFAVESGSAAQAVLEARGFDTNPVDSPSAALTEVAAGTSDTALVDALFAAVSVGEGTEHADLTCTVTLEPRECAVGFRPGSDLAGAVNAFLAAASADGVTQATARAYGIEDFLLP